MQQATLCTGVTFPELTAATQPSLQPQTIITPTAIWITDPHNYYKVAAVNSSGTGTLSSVASALLSADIQGSQTNEGHTYALTSSTMSWDSAATAAAAVGGHLATLNTKAENTWLYDKFYNYGGTKRDLWIGSLDNVTEGSWYWYNGTTSGDGGVSDNISSGAKWPDGTSK